MLKVEKNKISLTRGDTAYFDIAITDENGRPYTIHEGDQIIFSVKKDISDTDYAIQKKVKAGEAITILPTDTNKLSHGKYVYDVQLSTTLGEIFTIISKSVFCIGEEITR